MTLRGLIEAVERGESRKNIAGLGFAVGGSGQPSLICGIRADQWRNVLDAHDGSLDAAKRLHDALLPGWFPGMSQNIHDGEWFAWVQNKAGDHFTSFGDNPARCWLLAILRALDDQREGGRDG